MFSGALIRIPADLEVEKLSGANWKREQNNISLQSVIQFQESVIVNGETTARAAMVIHQDLKKEAFLYEENGRYSVAYRDTVETNWANIYIVPGLVTVDSLGNRDFVRETINKGLTLSIQAHNVYLDTAKMASDHADQWVRRFSDRLGRVDRGTVFGEGVEQDSIFGPELGRSKIESVGWSTNFFGLPVKVRVSPRGSVIVWSWPPIELFLKFLKMEILPYIIALPF